MKTPNRATRLVGGAVLAAFALPALPVLAAHSVTSGLTAQQMVDLIIAPGSGITQVGPATYTGAAAASGSFSGATAATGLPFASGLLLTSGSVLNSVGPNNSDGAEQLNGLGGSALLETVTGITPTLDASTLEFSFRSSSPVFSFQYAFGSEEYNEYIDQFNDVFAFVLTDSSGNSQNVATLPGGTPVAINNVNPGDFPEYYRNNDPSEIAPPLDIEYDGMVGGNPGYYLYATAALIPGELYTISIMIADTLDQRLDSGVFIGGGTFIDAPPPPQVPEPGTWASGAIIAGAAWGVYRRRARASSAVKTA